MSIEYRGFTIQEDFRNPYSKNPEYMFYPTEQGIQHDAESNGEDMKYCGNCLWESSIDEAKAEIDELQHLVKEGKLSDEDIAYNSRDYNPEELIK